MSTKKMTFSNALIALKDGKHVTRAGWNGKGQWLGLCIPDAHASANTLPYIYLITVDGKRVPWVASHTDLLWEDWVVVEH
jgi:Protein of unknown function (DUF2829)